MSLAAALLFAAATMETLAPTLTARESEVNDSSEPVDKNDPPVCTADKRYCFQFQDALESGVQLNLTGGAVEDGPHALTTMSLDREQQLSLWPHLVRIARPAAAGERASDALLYGLLVRESTMYSGGGASATTLHLYRADIAYDGRPLTREVFAMPIAASKMIRACFSEQDMKDRRGACHDEYAYDATLTLSDSGAAPNPAFALSVKASTFPGATSLDQDSTTRGKLGKSDLVKSEDTTCSYDRILRFNPATDRYEFDRPGPDCSDFTAL